MSVSSGRHANRRVAEECVSCGEAAAHRAVVRQEFAYRDGAHEVILHADIPVMQCEACGESFTAEGAEEAQHAAVCHYLGRLAPAEIRALRERLGLSQARLAERTQIGIASIKRWEAGSHIQNASLDRQLRALDLDAAAAPRSRRGFTFHFEPDDEAIDASHRFDLRPDCGLYADAA